MGQNKQACAWPGLSSSSAWYGECLEDFRVKVDNCSVSMTPAQHTSRLLGCPCWWFDINFHGRLASATEANLEQGEWLYGDDPSFLN